FIQNIGTGTVCDLAWGAKVQGYSKRELNDPLVSAQLWIIIRVEHDEYTIRNAMSCTYMDIQASAKLHFDWFATRAKPSKNMSSKLARWTIRRNNNKTAYLTSTWLAGTYHSLCMMGTENGTKIQIWEGIGPSTNHQLQLWHVVRA
ncbi:hypothetical protein BD311DRAFT_660675, partial [Dichomitus squalens]